MIVVRWMYPRDMLQCDVVRWVYRLDMVEWCGGYVLGTWYRQCSGEIVYHYEVALWAWLVVRWTPLTVHWYGEGAHLAEYNDLVCMFALCIMKQMIYNSIYIVPISLIQALKIFFHEECSGVITCFKDKGIFYGTLLSGHLLAEIFTTTVKGGPSSKNDSRKQPISAVILSESSSMMS